MNVKYYLSFFVSLFGFVKCDEDISKSNFTEFVIVNQTFVGLDCGSKQMKSCGSTGPYVCYEVKSKCPRIHG